MCTFFKEGCYLLLENTLDIVEVVVVQEGQNIVCEDISVGIRSRGSQTVSTTGQ